MSERIISDNTFENVDEKKSQLQTSEKFKHQNITIGCTVGSDCSTSNLINLKLLGVKHFQLLAKFSLNRGVFLPDEKLINQLDNLPITMHMPFYFHLLQPVSMKYRKYFVSMNNYWKTKNNKCCIIAHCKGINRDPLRTNQMLYENLLRYSRMCPDIRILVENDAGSKAKPAPKLVDIVEVKRRLRKMKIFNIGVCVDTEHAYAAGDSLFSINYRKDVAMIHLNAIPKQVVFGGHLDRHSRTALADSKNGINFVRKIFALMKKRTPLILERTDYNVLVRDIKLLKVMQNETLMDVDKKTLGKGVFKRSKILL
jgi:sugar phosphate isomerase/epimerase